MKGTVFDIKEMAVHDGPGIRTTVFLKGCPMRCIWCHNPEGLSQAPQLMFRSNACTGCRKCYEPCSHPECQPFGRCVKVCPNNCLEISGKEYTDDELAEELLKSRDAYGEGFGGVTFSGGEPLYQYDFLISVCDKLRSQGMHVCIETSGYASKSDFREMLFRADLLILDLKIIDRELHKKYTDVYNDRILENFSLLRFSRRNCIIRTPLIPGITDTEENLSKIAEMTEGMRWEKLPFNSLAGAKYRQLGMKYRIE